jgi:hypothetical protein
MFQDQLTMLPQNVCAVRPWNLDHFFKSGEELSYTKPAVWHNRSLNSFKISVDICDRYVLYWFLCLPDCEFPLHRLEAW